MSTQAPTQAWTVLAALVDLVLPRWCVGCEDPGTSWCVRCRPAGGPLCTSVDEVPVLAAARYEGAMRAALLAYKERGRRDLARPLASALAPAVAAATVRAGRPAVLVPIPSTRAAARARGGDHVRRLARLVSRTAELTVVTALRVRPDVQDSAGLDAVQRAANLAGAMCAVPPGRVRSVVLLDDITTSGTTIREATRALEAVGWQVQAAAVAAVTQRR
ncbi:MAG: phosphoribosyltransferase family protein [Jatrophihabitantaceae bacterium]